MKAKAQPQNIITAALWDYALGPTESSHWCTGSWLEGGGTEAKPPQSHSVNTDAGSHPSVDFGIQILVGPPAVPTPCPDTGWIRKCWLKIVTLEILKLF